MRFSRGEGGLILLKGRAGGGGGRAGICGEVSACKELERTSNSVFTCIRKKPSVLFCYCYMALILKFKSFILVSQIWRKKRREKREKRKI